MLFWSCMIGFCVLWVIAIVGENLWYRWQDRISLREQQEEAAAKAAVAAEPEKRVVHRS